jgi:hypothetical protein
VGTSSNKEITVRSVLERSFYHFGRENRRKESLWQRQMPVCELFHVFYHVRKRNGNLENTNFWKNTCAVKSHDPDKGDEETYSKLSLWTYMICKESCWCAPQVWFHLFAVSKGPKDIWHLAAFQNDLLFQSNRQWPTGRQKPDLLKERPKVSVSKGGTKFTALWDYSLI